MEMVSNYDVNVLKVHPQNSEFFDDISGEEYERFKRSIENEGVVSPIIIAPDMTIISGHQRVKACRDLEIKLIPAIMRETLIDEDEKLKTLLVANFGRYKNNKMKQSRVFTEYEKLCGVEHGGDRKSKRNNFALKQDDIAKQFGVDVRTLQNIKKLQDLIPELQTLVEDEKLNATVGYKVWAKLSADDQRKLVQELGTDIISEMTQKETQEFIKQKNIMEGEKLKLEQQIKNLCSQIKELESREPEVSKCTIA